MSMHASEKVNERGTGSVFLAAVLMIVGGSMAALMGVAGIVKDTFYVIPANYWITFNSLTWGWIFVGYGAVLLATGLGLLTRAEWARWLGITVMAVAAVLNFLFIPILPFMSMTLVAINLWIIHSLVVHAREPQMVYLNPASVSGQQLQEH
jgi:hypothetical protein